MSGVAQLWCGHMLRAKSAPPPRPPSQSILQLVSRAAGCWHCICVQQVAQPAAQQDSISPHRPALPANCSIALSLSSNLPPLTSKLAISRVGHNHRVRTARFYCDWARLAALAASATHEFCWAFSFPANRHNHSRPPFSYK